MQSAPLRHDGHPHLRTHTHNARRRPNQWGVTLGKVTRDSKSHVDLAVCMVGAVMGARIALNSGKLKRKKRGERSSSDCRLPHPPEPARSRLMAKKHNEYRF